MAGSDTLSAQSMIACPICDTLCRDRRPLMGRRLRCPRCKAVLKTARRDDVGTLLALTLAVPPLMAVGLLASFLKLGGGGIAHSASVFDIAGALTATGGWPLALATGALIMGVPTARSLSLIYVLAPLQMRRPAFRRAAPALRLAIALRPWAMAEIFLIGVAVAMIKLTGLASVTLGPAFWSFVALSVLALMEDAVLCERSLWDRIG